jgi:hypothetical protein
MGIPCTAESRAAAGAYRVAGHPRPAPSAAMSDAEVDAYRAKHHSDPRTWADTVIHVAPLRIQAREENELAGRTIMRSGIWVSG